MKFSHTLLIALPALLLCLAAGPAMGMGVIGIDYGAEWMKISLVKPGLPFDVVLGRDSKRKIQSVVGFKGDDRLFGADAFNVASRFPRDSFPALKFLLGRSYTDSQNSRQSSIFDTQLTSTDRNTCAARRSNDDVYSVEELIGMQLTHARELAEGTAGEKGLDAVITVPAYFTQAERMALSDAAGLAGLKPRLVSDGAAVAVNYAMTRTFPKPEYHLFYDAGAGSVKATVVEFSTRQVQADSVLSIGSTQRDAVVVDVKGVGWDRSVGGLALDELLRGHLANDFQTRSGSKLETPVTQNKRAMAKLMREANRVKHILSANAQSSAAVEGLAEDVDFRYKVTREEFEELAKEAGFLERFAKPVQDALENAGLKINDISSVVLVGGTSRVPMVQSALRTYVPDSLIAQNVNADEAAVMGAAFYGASFNQQFRMKDIRAYDINPYAVVLKEDSNNSEVIFPARSFHEDSLLRHFDTVEDIMFELEYDSDKLDTFSKHISHVEIQGITAALANLSSDLSNVDTQINVTFVSNPLGTFGVSSATLTVKPKPGGLAGALKSFFGVTSTKEDEETSLEGEEGDVKNETKPAKKEAKPKDRIIKLTALNAPRGNTSPLSGEELKKSKAKLREIDAAATRKAAREEARNSLEAYLYRIRDLVEDTNFVSASKNEERDLILKRADGLSSWIAEEGERAETSELKLRRAGLETLVKPIEKRLSQRTLRSGAIDKFRESLTKTERFLSEARANLSAALAEGSASKFSVSELDNLEGTFNRNSEWFQAKVKEQESKRLDEDPVLLTDDLEKRARKAEEVVNRLNKRRIPKTRPAKSAGKDKGKKAEQEKEEAPHKDEKKGPTHEEL